MPFGYAQGETFTSKQAHRRHRLKTRIVTLAPIMNSRNSR